MSTLKNRYTQKKERVIVSSAIVESKAIFLPDYLQKLSWKEFWDACQEEQRKYCKAVIYRKRFKLGWNWRRQNKIKESIKKLALQYIIF